MVVVCLCLEQYISFEVCLCVNGRVCLCVCNGMYPYVCTSIYVCMFVSVYIYVMDVCLVCVLCVSVPMSVAMGVGELAFLIGSCTLYSTDACMTCIVIYLMCVCVCVCVCVCECVLCGGRELHVWKMCSSVQRAIAWLIDTDAHIHCNIQ